MASGVHPAREKEGRNGDRDWLIDPVVAGVVGVVHESGRSGKRQASAYEPAEPACMEAGRSRLEFNDAITKASPGLKFYFQTHRSVWHFRLV